MLHLGKDEALVQLEIERERSAAFGGCVMCRLASAEHARDWIAESAHGVVVLDGYGATRGHLLVIARRHVERGSDLDWPVFADLQHLVWQASRALQAELSPARVYVASLGSSRPLPMSFPHHHTHVVPIYETDERARPANVFSWSSGVVRYARAEAEQLCSRLRSALARHAR
jgi:diadenosine tetraphosphate (Ap4A) HIT family hydrolase